MKRIRTTLSSWTVWAWLGLAAPTASYASIDAKGIAAQYQEGVVKILLYDPNLVKEFQLRPDQGYISRASGFFVTKEGVLFTNAHVVELCVNGYMIVDWEDSQGQQHKADFIPYFPGMEKDKAIRRIYYSGHTQPIVQVFSKEDHLSYQLYRAEVLALSTTFDGAMLRITGELGGEPAGRSHFQQLPLGNSDEAVLGEDLVVLGYPSQYLAGKLKDELKDTLTMTFGKHSGWDYVFDENNGLIKTDASIHEGNSGGPVFGEEKRVIGIATAMGAKTRIGLVGGINNMYWVVGPFPEILKQVSKGGLVAPRKSGKIETILGSQKPLPVYRPYPPETGQAQPLTLQGHVVGHLSPVGGARVEIWRYCESIGDYLPQTQTNSGADGQFSLMLDKAENTPYLLVVEAEGYERFTRPLSGQQSLVGITLLLAEKAASPTP